MNVLLVNKFLYLHGGVFRYCFELAKLLKAFKNKVAYFSMHDEKNLETKWSKYFVKYISFREKSISNSFRLIYRMFYSQESALKVLRLIEDFNPDVAHIHNIYHHLSPSLLRILKKRNVPTVMTVHDYHLIAPNYKLFHNGKTCEVTKTDSYYQAVIHKCIKDSYLASTACAIEMYLNKFLGLYLKNIDFFISPSQFMRSKLTEYGIDSSKIVHVPHFIDLAGYKANKKGNYILFFGRLVQEKGLDVLTEVAKKLSDIKLVIAGRGQYGDTMSRIIKKNQLSNIRLVGHKDGKELKDLICNSRFVILPSIWYENQPNSVLEAFASGKPVIASRIGGIPEIVKDSYNGLLFQAGNSSDLRKKILTLWSSKSFCQRLGKNAIEYVKKVHSKELHYQRIIKIYKMACEGRNK